LWVGGTKGAALRRAGRLADVWHPNDLTPAELLESGKRLDDLAGRVVPRSVRFDTTDDKLDGIVDLVDEYLAVGATRVVLEFRGQDTDAVTRRAEQAAKALFG
jgi:alkanesulfonate monooxygenase SsuD/methylene tetrahydromethanopterin reductase-like flavin-dependent oxidoreductase (luciferase family)